MFNKSETKIALIGLGYVGLPLAIEFAKKFKTIGYDINENRVNELNNYLDSTREVSSSSLKKALTTKNNKSGLSLSNDESILKDSNFYVVTVPTPTDKHKKPVLDPLRSCRRAKGNGKARRKTAPPIGK